MTYTRWRCHLISGKKLLSWVQGVPIERMADLWKSHWLWSRVVSKGSCGDHASEMGMLELSSSDAAQQGHQPDKK